jgi:hypothetical protein
MHPLSMKDRAHDLQRMQLSNRKELQKTIFTPISRQRDGAGLQVDRVESDLATA